MLKGFSGSKKACFLYTAGLFFIPLIFYWKITGFLFLNWDDDLYVTQNVFIRSFSPENIKAWFTHSYVSLYVPLTIASYAWNYAFGNLNPAHYHSANLLIHLVNTLLVFAFFRVFFKDRLLCFLGALLFSLHPVQGETVAWISQRKTLLFSFFILAGFNLWPRAHSYTGKAGAFSAWLAAFLCKANAISVLPLMIVYDSFFERNKRKNIFIYAALAAACLIVIFLTIGLYPAAAASISKMNPAVSIAARLQALWLYVQISIWPLFLKISYPGSFSFIHTAAGAVVFLLLTASFIFAWIRKATWGFWLGWFAACLLPVLNIYSIPPANHHLYLAFIGLIGLVLGVGEKYPRAAALILCAGLFISGILLPRELTSWRSSELLWKRSLAENQHDSRARIQLADFYTRTGDFKKAEALLQTGILQKPQEIDCYLNLGNLYLLTGQIESAQNLVRELEKNVPNHPAVNILLSGIALANNNFEECIRLAGLAASAYSSPIPDQYRAVAYLRLKKLPEAANALLNLQKSGALTAENRAQLGNVYLGMKKWAEGMAVLQSLEKDKILFPHLYFQIAYAAFNMNDLQTAYDYCIKNTAAEPQFAPAFYHAALIAEKSGQNAEADRFFEQAALLEPANPVFKKALNRRKNTGELQ